MDRLNVILPCAGPVGPDLPYPAELHALEPGRSVLDLSLERCLEAGSALERVTVVTRADKPALLELLGRWSERLPLAVVLAGDDDLEWPASVLASEHLFSTANVVLMPTGHFVEHPELHVLPTMLRRLETNDVVFAYAEEATERLAERGALAVAGNEVSAFCDRPGRDRERFNAFWASFGFRAERGRELLELMALSVRRKSISLEAFRASGFPVASYADLSDWAGLRAFQDRATSAPRRAA